MKNRLAAAAATMTCVLLTLGVANAPARAATVGDQASASVRVPTADLDLTSAAGTGKLERRIRTAAATVCRKDAEKPLGMRVLSRQCYRAAFSNGLRRMDQVIAMRGDLSRQRTAQRTTSAALTGSA